MNLSPRWVDHLENEGIECVHWSAIGDPRASDRVIFDFARAGGWTVFTHDLDFGHLLAITGSDGPSVLQLRGHEVLPETVGSTVVRVLLRHSQALVNGAIVTIDPEGARVRLLPI